MNHWRERIYIPSQIQRKMDLYHFRSFLLIILLMKAILAKPYTTHMYFCVPRHLFWRLILMQMSPICWQSMLICLSHFGDRGHSGWRVKDKTFQPWRFQIAKTFVELSPPFSIRVIMEPWSNIESQNTLKVINVFCKLCVGKCPCRFPFLFGSCEKAICEMQPQFPIKPRQKQGFFPSFTMPKLSLSLSQAPLAASLPASLVWFGLVSPWSSWPRTRPTSRPSSSWTSRRRVSRA